MVLFILIQVVIFYVFSSTATADKSIFPQVAFCCIELDTGDEFLRQGTLISTEYVTLNSNFLYGEKVEKVTCILGAHNISEYEPTQKWFDIPTDNIIVHEKHMKRKLLENNIALIKLPKPAKLSDYIQPAALPSKRYQHLASENIIGISRDKAAGALNTRSVIIANQSECIHTKGGYGEYNFCSFTECDNWGEHYFIKERHFSWILIGFVVSSRNVNDTWRKQVSCRIDHYLDWIYEHTNIPEVG